MQCEVSPTEQTCCLGLFPDWDTRLLLHRAGIICSLDTSQPLMSDVSAVLFLFPVNDHLLKVRDNSLFRYWFSFNDCVLKIS